MANPNTSPKPHELPRLELHERTYADILHPTLEDLDTLRQEGWYAFGVVAALVNENGEILMNIHKPSPKTQDRAIGPLAETTRIHAYEFGGTIVAQVESPKQTLLRCLKEEVGLVADGALDPRDLTVVSWDTFAWPSGVGLNRSFAICPVIQLTPEQTAQIEQRKHETVEIYESRFLNPQMILDTENTRPGTQDWSGLIVHSVGVLHTLPDTADSIIDTSATAWSIDAVLQSDEFKKFYDAIKSTQA